MLRCNDATSFSRERERPQYVRQHVCVRELSKALTGVDACRRRLLCRAQPSNPIACFSSPWSCLVTCTLTHSLCRTRVCSQVAGVDLAWSRVAHCTRRRDRRGSISRRGESLSSPPPTATRNFTLLCSSYVLSQPRRTPYNRPSRICNPFESIVWSLRVVQSLTRIPVCLSNSIRRSCRCDDTSIFYYDC